MSGLNSIGLLMAPVKDEHMVTVSTLSGYKAYLTRGISPAPGIEDKPMSLGM